jgi:AsnC-type helix-turn-helix domain
MRSEAIAGGIRDLDATDERILHLLEASGRISYEEIAHFVPTRSAGGSGRSPGAARSAASTPTSTGTAGPRRSRR